MRVCQGEVQAHGKDHREGNTELDWVGRCSGGTVETVAIVDAGQIVVRGQAGNLDHVDQRQSGKELDYADDRDDAAGGDQNSQERFQATHTDEAVGAQEDQPEPGGQQQQATVRCCLFHHLDRADHRDNIADENGDAEDHHGPSDRLRRHRNRK